MIYLLISLLICVSICFGFTGVCLYIWWRDHQDEKQGRKMKMSKKGQK